MWIIISIVVALLAVLIGVGVLLSIKRRSPDEPFGSEMSADQWTALGVVFFGAGVALWLTIGPAMIGMTAMGLVFMAVGIRVNRDSARK